MSQNLRAGTFAEHCPKGHRLQGWVTYCPFCGVLAVQPSAACPTGELAPQVVVRTPEPAPVVPTPVASMASVAEQPPPPLMTKQAAPLVVTPERVPRTEPVKMPLEHLEPPTAEPRRAPAGSGKWLVMGLIVALGGGAYFLAKPNVKEQACESALALAAKQLVAGDTTEARNQALLAIASCTGESQSKATSLKNAAEQGIAAQGSCERAMRTIDTLVTEHKLQKARSQLDDLNSVCSKSSAAERLRQKVSQDQETANGVATEVRTLLNEGELRGANSALERLTAANREHPNLAALRDDLLRLIKEQESRKAMAVELPKAVTEKTEFPNALPPLRPALPSPGPQASQAQSFILSAEQALAQKKFDRAKTQIENALNIDPHNAQATGLARRIKELELQYMREETVIK